MVVHYRGYHAIGYLNCIRRGSVFPNAFLIALPSAVVALGLKLIMEDENRKSDFGLEEPVVAESAVWSAFTFLVGFLIIFRTSEAHARFWGGCTATHSMRAEWFDACASCIAFTKHSLEAKSKVVAFQHTLIRLFSMLHAVALAEIEDCETDDPTNVHAFEYPLIDVVGIDPESLSTLKDSVCKVELVFQWIQQAIVENIRTNVMSIPPPLLSRVFDELATGMVYFHDAMKISTIPFPFPYAQTCQWLLIMHWFTTPVVCAHWVSTPAWTFIFAFIQVFVMWTLNLIAVEIENPFGMDANDIDAAALQQELNTFLLQLISTRQIKTPRLTDRARRQCTEADSDRLLSRNRTSLLTSWVDMGSDESSKTNNSAPNASSVHDSLRTHSSLPESGRLHSRKGSFTGSNQSGMLFATYSSDRTQSESIPRTGSNNQNRPVMARSCRIKRRGTTSSLATYESNRPGNAASPERAAVAHAVMGIASEASSVEPPSPGDSDCLGSNHSGIFKRASRIVEEPTQSEQTPAVPTYSPQTSLAPIPDGAPPEDEEKMGPQGGSIIMCELHYV